MQRGKSHTVRGVADQGKVDFAREQRREPTPGERSLWYALRGEKLGVRFRRQHPIEDFVLDFYCAEARLAVEVDGASHDDREGYDAWHDGALASWGIRVLRFSESDVTDRLSEALREIRVAVEDGKG